MKPPVTKPRKPAAPPPRDTTLRDAAALFRRADMVIKAGYLEWAIKVYENIASRLSGESELELRKKAAYALVGKGMALNLLGEKDAALATFNHVINHFGNKLLNGGIYPVIAVGKALFEKSGLLDEREMHDAASAALLEIETRFGEAAIDLRELDDGWPLRFGEGAIELRKLHGDWPVDEESEAIFELNNPTTRPPVAERPSSVIIPPRDIDGQAGENLTHAFDNRQEPKPFKLLSDKAVAAFMEHAKAHQWDDRRKDGWPYFTNAFKFVDATYSRFIPGLTRDLIAAADDSLARHLYKKISVEGLPDWLDLPTAAEARLRSMSDPVDRYKLLGVREYFREQQQQHRNRKAGLGD
jgi:hypothetical protein